MVIVVMGVSGAGKTTIGRMLAAQMGWEFRDADDLHSAANKNKMASGIALTDADRAPWLASIRDLIATSIAQNANLVLACSALKQSYRDQIVVDPERVKIVYLKGSRELIASRIAHRKSHFMNKDLLASQFDTLEEPRDAIEVDVAAAPEAIVADIRKQLRI
ncbi:MAG TPA: gluconokinase [Candidatus Binataceae bacterium]|nr:gluconokinase [Candidatus Binataceae bacterium]